MKIAILLKLSVLGRIRPCLHTRSPAPRPISPADWEGTLDAGGTSFHIVWHATAAPDGTLTSTFDNVDQKYPRHQSEEPRFEGF